jgi:biopolymer transport protein ExbD
VQVELPKSVVGPVDATEAVNIGINRAGQISIGENPKTMSFEAFRATIGIYIANKHPKSANIRADTHLQYGVLTQVMGVLNAHKLPLNLLAEPMDQP